MYKPPVATLHLFPLLEDRLMQLLASLTEEEWHAPTIAKEWRVKDVAAHLLDGNLRAISMMRDKYFGLNPPSIQSNDDLVRFLNNLNASWVDACKRLSSGVLLQWMQQTGKEYIQQLNQLDLEAPAMFAVSWAGDETSPNWFHIAREYTERWHHQQQIRDAVNKPGIMSNDLYYPVLETFMRALPFNYRNTDAIENSLIKIIITGDGGGEWQLVKKENWVLDKDNGQPPATTITINGAIAWKLFTKSWRKKDIQGQFSIMGNETLAEPVLQMVAVVA